MKINDACLVDAAVQLVYIIGKLDTVVLDDVAGTCLLYTSDAADEL